MSNITIPGDAVQWKSTALAAGLEVIPARRNESVVQRPVDLRIDSCQPAVNGTKEITLVEHRVACGIGVYDYALGVDQKDRGT